MEEKLSGWLSNCVGEPDPAVAVIEYGVVFADEHVAQNPERPDRGWNIHTEEAGDADRQTRVVSMANRLDDVIVGLQGKFSVTNRESDVG